MLEESELLYINKIKPNFTEPQTQTTLGGIPAIKYTFSNINFDVYLVQVGANYIDAYVSNDPTKKTIANRILSTFKFISASPQPSNTPVSTQSGTTINQ